MTINTKIKDSLASCSSCQSTNKQRSKEDNGDENDNMAPKDKNEMDKNFQNSTTTTTTTSSSFQMNPHAESQNNIIIIKKRQHNDICKPSSCTSTSNKKRLKKMQNKNEDERRKKKEEEEEGFNMMEEAGAFPICSSVSPNNMSNAISNIEAKNPPPAKNPNQNWNETKMMTTTATTTTTKQQQQQQQCLENEQQETSKDDHECCLLCGSSFSSKVSQKSRWMHLKRCAKKHGITSVRDIMQHNDDDDDDDDEDEDDDDSFVDSTNNNNQTQTYDNQTNSSQLKWHTHTTTTSATATTSTAMATTSTSSSTSSLSFLSSFSLPFQSTSSTTIIDHNMTSTSNNNNNKNTSTKQMSITSWLPKKSLNQVLLAGAKQKAADEKKMKTKHVVSHNHNKNNNNNNNKRRIGRWARKSQASSSSASCPSHKRIPGTDFICDGFTYANKNLSSNYFLTHFHSDHYGGITASWNQGIIYCSLPTANLLHQHLGVSTTFLHPLPLLTPTIIQSRHNNNNPVDVTVTLIDANHCPGAVMFLFQISGTTTTTNTKKKNILHVGDFRWDRNIMMKSSILQSCSSSLNQIFLDTTYCNIQYKQMPTQTQAIDATIEMIQTELAHPSNNSSNNNNNNKKKRILFLFGSYTIGKERLYLTVAQRLGIKVYVDKRKYKTLSYLGWPKEQWMPLVTTNKKETMFWVVPLGHINFKQMMKSYYDCNNNNNKNKNNNNKSYDKIIGFRPTGWTMSSSSLSSSSLSSSNKPQIITTTKKGPLTVHGVPYSEHSSFSELVDCLKCLQPKKIVPTVSISKSQEQCDLLLTALSQQEEEEEQGGGGEGIRNS